MDRALVILQDLCRFHVHSENKPNTAVPGIYYCFTLSIGLQIQLYLVCTLFTGLQIQLYLVCTLFTGLQIQLYLVCTLFTGLQTQLYLVCTILCLQVYKYSCTWYVLLSYFVYRFTNTAVPSVYYCLTLSTGLQIQLYLVCTLFTGLQTQLYLVCTTLCLQGYKYSCTWYVLLSYFVYRFTNTAVHGIYYYFTLFTD